MRPIKIPAKSQSRSSCGVSRLEILEILLILGAPGTEEKKARIGRRKLNLAGERLSSKGSKDQENVQKPNLLYYLISCILSSYPHWGQMAWRFSRWLCITCAVTRGSAGIAALLYHWALKCNRSTAIRTPTRFVEQRPANSSIQCDERSNGRTFHRLFG